MTEACMPNVPPALENEMLGGGKIETGQMISIFVSIVKCNISTSMVRMTARVIGSQYNLGSP